VLFTIELAAPATLEFTFSSVKGRKAKKLKGPAKTLNFTVKR
jgi:hypothetical protein